MRGLRKSFVAGIVLLLASASGLLAQTPAWWIAEPTPQTPAALEAALSEDLPLEALLQGFPPAMSTAACVARSNVDARRNPWSPPAVFPVSSVFG